MPVFSKSSYDKLLTCDNSLQLVFNKVIMKTDCTVLEGERSFADQQNYYRTGRSKLDPSNPILLKKCMHLKSPSQAIDVLPYPIDWNDKERISLFAGFVLGIASNLNIKIRWGGNWDSDLTVLKSTANFFDGPHFELITE